MCFSCVLFCVSCLCVYGCIYDCVPLFFCFFSVVFRSFLFNFAFCYRIFLCSDGHKLSFVLCLIFKNGKFFCFDLLFD